MIHLKFVESDGMCIFGLKKAIEKKHINGRKISE
jgi:hypothetical protein